jgi:hypothetical protein
MSQSAPRMGSTSAQNSDKSCKRCIQNGDKTAATAAVFVVVSMVGCIGYAPVGLTATRKESAKATNSTLTTVVVLGGGPTSGPGRGLE